MTGHGKLWCTLAPVYEGGGEWSSAYLENESIEVRQRRGFESLKWKGSLPSALLSRRVHSSVRQVADASLSPRLVPSASARCRSEHRISG